MKNYTRIGALIIAGVLLVVVAILLKMDLMSTDTARSGFFGLVMTRVFLWGRHAKRPTKQ